MQSVRLKSETKTETSIICPNCGEDSGIKVDVYKKLGLPYTFLSGTCESCGREYSKVTINSLSDVEVELKDTFSVDQYVLLKMEPQKNPVYIVIKAKDFGRGGDAKDDDSKRYYYEEHSCPINYLGVVLIAEGGDTDPHGIFEYVRSLDCPELDPSYCDDKIPPVDQKFTIDASTEDEYLTKVFPELLVDKQALL
jgi:predicted RNA-binding Zn-ribbon protein involved in translation (DUF1610 family)